MGAIIVAMPQVTDSRRIADIIKNSEIPNETVTCTSGSEVLRRVENTDVDLVIGTKSFSDMGFEELVNWSIPETDMLVLIGGDNLVCLPKDGDLYA